ncbi:MAG: cob(I)yrinic acid a,c-diamide adenosyltransferase [Candidatus Krumholzibacteriia bacterium]|nr:cob(I)yrinic acid a,c-diamide adenosyltransferase [bacterium]MCB9516576.1 cob(I)yrinic acid a,c-diamide adenosyltransferase [Candidatus Latescibacterota bacterium]
MKIYTRGGDKGRTGLLGGTRTGKDDPRIEAYGSVDELGAQLGLADALDESGELSPLIHAIQRDLFTVGSHLASPDPSAASLPPLDPEGPARLEGWIDRLEADLPPLRQFILPGGCAQAAALHLGRTVCRRAERRVVALAAAGLNVSEDLIVYLNRLSDFLFVAARWANRRAGAHEEPWHTD